MKKKELIEDKKIALIFTDSDKCQDFEKFLILKNLRKDEKDILMKRFKLCEYNDIFCYIIFGDIPLLEIVQAIENIH